LFLLALLAPAGAELPQHPFAAPSQSSLSLEGPSLLEWGTSTLGYSQTWYGGESRSQGFLLKEFRSVLHPSLEFKARFGMSFQPGAMNGSGDENARFEIPEASLTWRPGGNTVIRLHFQQGSLGQSLPYSTGSSAFDSQFGIFDPFAETP
jgi:hypothetical protein